VLVETHSFDPAGSRPAQYTRCSGSGASALGASNRVDWRLTCGLIGTCEPAQLNESAARTLQVATLHMDPVHQECGFFCWFFGCSDLILHTAHMQLNRFTFDGENTMRRTTTIGTVLLGMAALLMQGCAAPNVNFAEIQRPARAPELDAYNDFVGSWNWEAEMVTAEGPGDKWTGSAEWKWTLDDMTLHGLLSARTEDAEFDAAGVWSWHPKKRKYIWWMFNNWGYPQEGTAKYDAANKHWTMDYKAVGLDGTNSYGRYEMTVLDQNTLDWRVTEWADVLHMIKKMEMTGAYTRK